MGVELFHAAGKKDGLSVTTKPTVAFRNFASAPKNEDLLGGRPGIRHKRLYIVDGDSSVGIVTTTRAG